MRTLFHLAFPIYDFKVAKAFYVDGLECFLSALDSLGFNEAS